MLIQAIIEIPQGSLLKYEHQPDDSLLVDRLLNQPYPFNYGYIPHTICEDGDPLDVFVLGDIAIFPLARVNIKPISIIYCKDNGLEDNKLIAVLDGDEKSSSMGLDIILSFLRSYKPGFEVIKIGTQQEAIEVHKNCTL